jgi:hypothetical protein
MVDCQRKAAEMHLKCWRSNHYGTLSRQRMLYVVWEKLEEGSLLLLQFDRRGK